MRTRSRLRASPETCQPNLHGRARERFAHDVPNGPCGDARRTPLVVRTTTARHKRLLGLVMLAVITVVGSACAPAVRSASYRGNTNAPRIGFNVSGIGPSADRELSLLAASGAKWVRVDFNWPTLAPTRTTRNWAPADHFVAVANSLG